jgi:hypothetical protein
MMEASKTPTIEEIQAEAQAALGLPSDEERAPKRVTTADGLKQRALHRGVVLPSGAIVDIRIPNLALLIKSGTLPNDLIQSALKTQNVEEVTREMIEENWDYTAFILPRMLVSPEITEEDVGELDALDIELLTNIAARRTDVDAIGRQLGGLDTQSSFREFREIESLRASLGGF